MIIHVLSDQLANQIAAGEVVERPTSVVRELVDNAVDAQATDIRIWLDDGGIDRIRVADNGTGMGAEDALLCFRRHATSKVSTARDLHAIGSLGFRGEALPSIAAVSQVRMRTKVRADALGTEVSVYGGQMSEGKSCACSDGTDIEVARLFFNTPARRKFLRSPRYEEGRVKLWLSQSSLIFPHIRYQLIVNGKEALLLPPCESFVERAARAFRGSQVRVNYRAGDMLVEGLLLHPAHAESEAGGLSLFVNRRLVTDKAVARAVRDAFGGTLKPREFPVGALHITTPLEFVDVNVHPQKSEVRFQSSGAVFKAVYEAVHHALKDFSGGVSMGAMTTDSIGGLAYRRLPPAQANMETQGSLALAHQVSPQEGSTENHAESAVFGLNVFSRSLLQERAIQFSELKYLGQVFDCYLLCVGPGGFYCVDMHAAHERYHFNLIRHRLRSGVSDGKFPAQIFLRPERITLGRGGGLRIGPYMEELSRIGFRANIVDDFTIEVFEAPSLFDVSRLEVLFRDLVSDHEEPGVRPLDHAIDVHLDSLAARMACHASIRSGKSLSTEEVYELFRCLDEAEFSAACPHGRPIIVGFKRTDFEKWFGRID